MSILSKKSIGAKTFLYQKMFNVELSTKFFDFFFVSRETYSALKSEIVDKIVENCPDYSQIFVENLSVLLINYLYIITKAQQMQVLPLF